ncbi:protein kinase, partial [Streptomyces hydrogenans]|uniref:serine/threonine protein kinase n=1 Tax=Streptomyces hydrogenans TaxID=1873719 RepID=UPI00381ECF14
MDPLRPGQDPARIGDHTLLGRLGAGGMGQVYLARTPDGGTVALKVIREEITEHPEVLARFRREVATVRTVRGPHTARLVDASLDEAPYWLATEYVPGPTLRQAIAAQGPLGAEAGRTLFAQLARALESVHAYGVTHRDLKPQNVILAAEGPRLIDFGIARGPDDTALTRTGAVPGTPGFTAPEVLLRNETSPAADVFALGATMAYATTGRPPFGDGPAEAVSYRAVHEDIDLPDGTDGTDGPYDLRALIRACVAKDPGERPGTAEVIARCAAPADEALPPTRLDPAPPAAGTVAPARARRSGWGTVALVLLLTGAAGTAAWQQGWGSAAPDTGAGAGVGGEETGGEGAERHRAPGDEADRGHHAGEQLRGRLGLPVGAGGDRADDGAEGEAGVAEGEPVRVPRRRGQRGEQEQRATGQVGGDDAPRGAEARGHPDRDGGAGERADPVHGQHEAELDGVEAGLADQVEG